jgi:methionine--tRNA ligase beta chain
MKYSNIGGQAVMEGVMMRNGANYAVAVRTVDKEIVVKTGEYHSFCKNEKVKKLPIIRGVFNFIDSLYLGMTTLMYSANFFAEESPQELEDRLSDEKKKAEKKAAEQPVNVAVIGVEDFAKLQLKVAKVLEAERVENADKLLKLQVDCGEKRQIVAGVAAYYKPEEIVSKLIVMVVNLKPAVIRGIESNGMLLAAKKKNELRLLTVDGDIVPGASIG